LNNWADELWKLTTANIVSHLLLTKKSELNFNDKNVYPTSLHGRILTSHVFLYCVKRSLHKSHLINTFVIAVAILEWKTGVSLRDQGKSSGDQHKCLSCLVIIPCNEDRFAMINPIKPNIGLWMSSEPSSESLQIVWNFAGWKLSALYVNQANFNVKLSTKLGGGKQGASQKSGDHGPHRPP